MTISGTDREAGTPAGESPDAKTSAGRLTAVLDGFRRQPALLAVYLLYFAANVSLYVIVVFYPQLLETVGVSSSLWIGLYLAVNGLAGGVSAVLYDRLKARVGPRRLVRWALLLWAIAFGLAAGLRSPVGLAVPAALFGLGVGLVFPSAFGWIEALAPKRLQGQFSSYLAMAGYLGQFASPLLFGVALAPFGVRGVFAVAAIAAAVGLSGVGLATVASDRGVSASRPR